MPMTNPTAAARCRGPWTVDSTIATTSSRGGALEVVAVTITASQSTVQVCGELDVAARAAAVSKLIPGTSDSPLLVVATAC